MTARTFDSDPLERLRELAKEYYGEHGVVLRRIAANIAREYVRRPTQEQLDELCAALKRAMDLIPGDARGFEDYELLDYLRIMLGPAPTTKEQGDASSV